MSALLDQTLIKSRYKVALCLDANDFYATLTEHKVPQKKWPLFLQEEELACLHSFDLKAPEKLALVCVSKQVQNGKVIDAYLTLVHEAVHIVQDSMEYMCETSPSKEFFAYSIERISKQLITEYVNRRKHKET